MTNETETDGKQLQRRITRIEDRVDRIEDKAEEALHLVRHQLTILQAAWNGKRIMWGHCSCGGWDDRSPDVDIVAEMHHRHRDRELQPALF